MPIHAPLTVSMHVQIVVTILAPVCVLGFVLEFVLVTNVQVLVLVIVPQCVLEVAPILVKIHVTLYVVLDAQLYVLVVVLGDAIALVQGAGVVLVIAMQHVKCGVGLLAALGVLRLVVVVSVMAVLVVVVALVKVVVVPQLVVNVVVDAILAVLVRVMAAVGYALVRA